MPLGFIKEHGMISREAGADKPVASPQVFDIDMLSQPVAPDRPCGDDLREDVTPNSIYHAIKDARNEARRAERRIESGEEDVERPDWRRVEELALEMLRAHTKDLQIVAWLLEALVRRHGFAGLRDGLTLARRLIEAHWEDLYPVEEEDGVLDRLAPLIGLNGEGADGTLIVPLRLTPLTRDQISDTSYALYHYEQAVSLAAIADPDDREQRVSAGARTLDQLSAAGRASGEQFYRDLLDDIQAARQELDALTDRLAECCDEAMVPSSAIHCLLEQCFDAARQIAGPLVPATQQAVSGDDQADPSATASASRSSDRSTADVVGGAVRTREEAFRSLLVIAEYFRKTEPHSPVSYGLEQVVRWGRMDLPELMQELIADDSSRGHVFSLTGIKRDAE